MGDASGFLNNPDIRSALHAPTSKDWEMQFPFVFGDPDGEWALSFFRSEKFFSLRHTHQLAVDPSKFFFFETKAS